jgi:hypothetical protein
MPIASDAFLDYSSSGTLIIIRLKNQIIQINLGASKLKSLHSIAENGVLFLFKPSIDLIFQSWWFLSGIPRLWVAANKETTEPRIPIGKVQVITSKVLRYGTSMSQMTTDMLHFAVPSSFMTCHRACSYSNTTGATSGAGTFYPSKALEFSLRFLVGFVFLDL